FLPRNPHRVVNAGEDGRLDKNPVAGSRLPPKEALRPLSLCDLAVIEYLVILRRRRDRAAIGVRFHRVADLGGASKLQMTGEDRPQRRARHPWCHHPPETV